MVFKEYRRNDKVYEDGVGGRVWVGRINVCLPYSMCTAF